MSGQSEPIKTTAAGESACFNVFCRFPSNRVLVRFGLPGVDRKGSTERPNSRAQESPMLD
jgi:hypothetical protein